jgi:hypothetical protein
MNEDEDKDSVKQEVNSDSEKHQKRMDLFESLLKNPKLKSIFYLLPYEYGLWRKEIEDLEAIKDMEQEIRLALYNEIVIKGEDQNTVSWYLQFVRNRGRNYLTRKVLRLQIRETPVGEIDDALESLDKDDEGIQGFYAKHVSMGSDRFCAQRELEERVLRKAAHFLRGHYRKKEEQIVELTERFLELRDYDRLSDDQKSILEEVRKQIEQFRSQHTEPKSKILPLSNSFSFEKIREKLGYEESYFNDLVDRIVNEVRYIIWPPTASTRWNMYSLRRLCAEKFERVLRLIYEEKNEYIPLRRKKWKKKKPYSTQKVSSAV